MDTSHIENTRRHIRRFRDSDKDEVVGVWYRSGKAAYTFLPTWQALTLEQAYWVFENIIRPKCKIWVGILDEHIVAYLAMNESFIDRLYVDPPEWHKGWGSQLITLAKKLSPSGLELYTHQENYGARVFYEHHGFKPVKFGTSPPPESAPDVEYHWRP